MSDPQEQSARPAVTKLMGEMYAEARRRRARKAIDRLLRLHASELQTQFKTTAQELAARVLQRAISGFADKKPFK